MKVSVVLPAYNRAENLKVSIASVLNQTFSDFELILVDDGSTDNTKEVVESFEDKRIRYFYTELNKGAAAARNYGLSKVQGEYIAFEDSDDLWHNDKLEKQLQCLEMHQEAGFVYHKIRYDFGDNQYAILPSEEVSIDKKQGNIFTQMLYDNLVPCPSIFMTRKCLEDTGLFDESFQALEDYDFALRMSSRYQAAFVDEVLLEAGFSDSGVSGNPVNYLLASCMLVQKFKADYLKTDTLNHRLSIILRDAKQIGMEEQFVGLLEKIMQAGV